MPSSCSAPSSSGRCEALRSKVTPWQTTCWVPTFPPHVLFPEAKNKSDSVVVFWLWEFLCTSVGFTRLILYTCNYTNTHWSLLSIAQCFCFSYSVVTVHDLWKNVMTWQMEAFISSNIKQVNDITNNKKTDSENKLFWSVSARSLYVVVAR